jgi:DNA-binding beta-propeller fold protein YncE
MLVRVLRTAFRFAMPLLGMGIGAAWAQNEIFVDNSDTNSVTVFSRTASGNVAPIRTIAGAATGINSPEGIAVDSVNSEIFVANDFPANGTINVYGLTANGNVAPIRTIAGAATGMATPRGVAVDPVNNELFVVQVSTPAIAVYARTANGNVAPLRTIVGAATGLNGPIGIAIDTVNNELLVANISANTITVYSRTASGNAAPLRTIAGAATGLDLPESVAVDTVNNELAVANFNAKSVTVYARTSSGNVSPTRTIIGPATGLSDPVGIAVDAVNNELLATNINVNTVTAYSRTATGNVAPVRSIGGAATALNAPVFVAVTTGPASPVLQSAASRKVHGGAGTFNLPLSLAAANPTTEPRQGPTHTIVITFDKPLTAATASVTEGSAVAGAPTFSGNDVSVSLTGVADRQYVTVSLANVIAADGGSGGSGAVRIGFLTGDVTQNRVVTLSDLGRVNAQLAQPVTALNFINDVNASGTLSIADMGITNANLTKSLPAP